MAEWRSVLQGRHARQQPQGVDWVMPVAEILDGCRSQTASPPGGAAVLKGQDLQAFANQAEQSLKP
jgi:hypothetical protein